jgi:hypothetical protein
MQLIIILAASVFLSSCTSESIQSGEATKNASPGAASAIQNHPPVIQSARIVPSPVFLNKSVSVQSDATDPDGDMVTFRHQWRVNEQLIPGETHSILDPKMVKRGDRLSVEVTPYDGNTEGAPVIVETIVGNTPPDVIAFTLEPGEVRVGTAIRAEVTGTDADQDPIEYRYRWWRNNSEVADGYMSELDTAGFAKGDTIVVEVTPLDPTSKGKSKLSKPITILNSAPTITSVPPTKLDRGRFIYTVTSKDPDDDPLIYALEVAPPGMKIDKTSGQIEWPLTAKASGRYKVRVTATDPEEASAFQEFELTIAAPASSSRPTFRKTSVSILALSGPFPLC